VKNARKLKRLEYPKPFYPGYSCYCVRRISGKFNIFLAQLNSTKFITVKIFPLNLNSFSKDMPHPRTHRLKSVSSPGGTLPDYNYFRCGSS